MVVGVKNLERRVLALLGTTTERNEQARCPSDSLRASRRYKEKAKRRTRYCSTVKRTGWMKMVLPVWMETL